MAELNVLQLVTASFSEVLKQSRHHLILLADVYTSHQADTTADMLTYQLT